LTQRKVEYAARDKQIDAKLVEKAIKDLGIDPEKKNPAIS